MVISITFSIIARSKSDVQLWIDIENHQNFIFLRNFQSYFKKILPYSTSDLIQSIFQSLILLLNVSPIAMRQTATIKENIAVALSVIHMSRMQEESSSTSKCDSTLSSKKE